MRLEVFSLNLESNLSQVCMSKKFFAAINITSSLFGISTFPFVTMIVCQPSVHPVSECFSCDTHPIHWRHYLSTCYKQEMSKASYIYVHIDCVQLHSSRYLCKKKYLLSGLTHLLCSTVQMSLINVQSVKTTTFNQSKWNYL